MKICPMFSYGGSTGCDPIHVRMITTFAKLQNAIFDMGLGDSVRARFFCVIGKIIRIRIDTMRATTPPSLLGIERRMA